MQSLLRRLADTSTRSTVGLGERSDAVVGRVFSGPAWRLPKVLDRAVEGWWRVPVRLRMLAVLVLALLVTFGIVRHTSRSPWGPDLAVVVATADAAAGKPVAADIVTRPADLVPEDALHAVPDGRLARDVVAGQVLTERHVVGGLPALLEDDEVALALDQPMPPLPDHARLEVMGLALDGTGRRLATARLLVVEDEWTWIALGRDAAPAVAAALDTGGIRLVVAPPEPAGTGTPHGRGDPTARQARPR